MKRLIFFLVARHSPIDPKSLKHNESLLPEITGSRSILIKFFPFFCAVLHFHSSAVCSRLLLVYRHSVAVKAVSRLQKQKKAKGRCVYAMVEEEQRNKRTRSYVEEAFRQISEQPDVFDIIILNAAGNPVKSTMDETSSLQHAGSFELLLQKAKYMVQQLDEEDDVISLRVRTKYHEAIITPDEKITFLVIQNATDRMQKEVVS